MNLRIKKLSFGYNDQYLFKDVSFSLSEGEHFSIIGKSGSGKSSLLECILDIHEYDGEISYNGTLSVAFQDPVLIPNFTVLENILVSGKDEQHAIYLTKLFGINKLLHQYPSELSGGEKQRVSLARAINKKPDILLLDEPFSGLDRLTKKKMYRELKNILKQFPRMSVVLVTHMYKEACLFADKGLILTPNNHFIDTIENFYFKPKNLDVAHMSGNVVVINKNDRVSLKTNSRFSRQEWIHPVLATGNDQQTFKVVDTTFLGKKSKIILDPPLSFNVTSEGHTIGKGDVIHLNISRSFEV